MSEKGTIIVPGKKKILRIVPGVSAETAAAQVSKMGGKTMAMEYAGGVISLTPDGRHLLWSRTVNDSPICFELILGSLIRTIDVLKSAKSKKGVKLDRAVADKIIGDAEVALGRRAPKAAKETEEAKEPKEEKNAESG